MEPSHSQHRRFGAPVAVEKTAARGEQATTLRTLYAPVLAYIVLFERSRDKNSVAADKFRAEVRAALDRAGQLALMAGYAPERIDHVRFSVVAFVDEVVLNSDWTYRNDWMERPMQYEEFETAIAGDQFFDRLEGAGESDPEVAEIDFVVLSLGFKGRHVGDETKLTEIRRKLFKKFPPQAVLSIPHLTPEAYEEKVLGIEEVSDRWKVWKWVVVGGVGLLVVVVWALLQLSMSGTVRAFSDAVR